MAKEYRLSIIVSGRDAGARSMLGGIGSALGSIGTIAGGILTSQVFTFIANQIANMASQAFNAVAQMQSLEMTLVNLQARELMKTGDFEDMNAALREAGPLAKATMDELERIATLSPYQLATVANTYKMAMAFGFSAKEATVFTNATLTMASGIGASNEMLDRMSYNLAQIRLQGKVTAMDIRQLAMAGFDLTDVLKYVGKQMDVNIESHEDFNKAIAEGKITWEDFTKYYAEYADKNFGGASERMARTLEGLKSTFADVFMLTMPKIFGPAADKITGWLNELLDEFMLFKDSGVLDQFGQDLADALDSPYLRNGLLGLTQWFRNWTAEDWDEVSAKIAEGIDSIDWSMLGERFRLGMENIFVGLQNMDFTEIANSLTEGFADFVLAALGSENNWEQVMTIWRSNFDQLNQIVTTSMELIKQNGTTQAAAIGFAIPQNIALALTAGTGGIMAVIWRWLPEAEAILIGMKKMFEAQFQQMPQAAIRALLGMAPFLVEAVETIINMAIAALKPINISISLPNFEALAARAAEGMALLNAALSGGGSSKGAQVGGGNAIGGTIGAGHNPYSGGGIARGPLSGYPATLHGTEAVIPLERGNVPIKLMGALTPSGGGGTFVQVVFQYAPALSTASRHEAEDVIAPVIAEQMRSEFQKRGM